MTSRPPKRSVTDGPEAAAPSAAVDSAHAERAASGPGHNDLWAALMRRSLGLDVLACARCGGRHRLIVVIDDPAVVERILRHLALPTEIPAARPARAPPVHLLGDAAPTGGALNEFFFDDPA